MGKILLTAVVLFSSAYCLYGVGGWRLICGVFLALWFLNLDNSCGR